MIPQIDKEIGISVYTTKSPSISGKIKQNENDFLVIIYDPSCEIFQKIEIWGREKTKKVSINFDMKCSELNLNKNEVIFNINYI